MGYSPGYPRAAKGVERMSYAMQKAVLADTKRRMQAAHAAELAALTKLLTRKSSKQFSKEIRERLQAIRSRVHSKKKKKKHVRFAS